MKKGYRYKLEAVLKMRKLKEDQLKMQIGKLNVKLTEYEGLIVGHESGIAEAYEAQEAELKGGLNGQEIRFHPYFVQGKRAHIDLIKAEIQRIMAEREKLYEKLKLARGDVKVMEKLKEKDFKQYKKAINKKKDELIEEGVIAWNHRRTKSV